MRRKRNRSNVPETEILGSVVDLEKKTKRRKKLRLILIVVILCVAAVYFAGVFYFQNHFCGDGTVYGIEISNRTPEEVEELLSDKIAEYQLTISTRTGEETIQADEISLQYADTGVVESLKEEQNPWLWFLYLFRDSGETKIEVSYDESKLAELLDSFSFLQEDSMEAPVNASLTYSESEGAFVISVSEPGTQLTAETVCEAVGEAVLAGEEEIDLDEAGCYAEPEITEDNEELNSELEDVNALLDVEIIYDFSDRTETVNADQISEWITFGDDFTWELDRDKVYDYVYNLGLEYDTFGLSREFTTHSGSTVSLSGGDYGWLIAKDDTTDALIEMIENGESGTVEPVYSYSGVCRDTNDIGDTYVEICISAQTMWFYLDGECIVETAVVTGTANNSERATPSNGVWAIDAKMTDYYLTGQGYNSYVNYWMPFNGNVGIHDASWRDSFGGSIYLTNGSHGCINTPLTAAQTIYENISIGDPVVIYD